MGRHFHGGCIEAYDLSVCGRGARRGVAWARRVAGDEI